MSVGSPSIDGIRIANALNHQANLLAEQNRIQAHLVNLNLEVARLKDEEIFLQREFANDDKERTRLFKLLFEGKTQIELVNSSTSISVQEHFSSCEYYMRFINADFSLLNTMEQFELHHFVTEKFNIIIEESRQKIPTLIRSQYSQMISKFNEVYENITELDEEISNIMQSINQLQKDIAITSHKIYVKKENLHRLNKKIAKRTTWIKNRNWVLIGLPLIPLVLFSWLILSGTESDADAVVAMLMIAFFAMILIFTYSTQSPNIRRNLAKIRRESRTDKDELERDLSTFNQELEQRVPNLETLSQELEEKRSEIDQLSAKVRSKYHLASDTSLYVI